MRKSSAQFDETVLQSRERAKRLRVGAKSRGANDLLRGRDAHAGKATLVAIPVGEIAADRGVVPSGDVELQQRVGERPTRQARTHRASAIECAHQPRKVEGFYLAVMESIRRAGVEIAARIQDQLEAKDAVLSAVPVLEDHPVIAACAHDEILARFREAEVGIANAAAEREGVIPCAVSDKGV